MGYKTYEITTEAGRNVSTLKADENELNAANKIFAVKMRSDGNVESVKNLLTNRELVNNKSELPFNELLRVEGNDASKIAYPFAPKITVKKGEQMTQIWVERARSAYPLTILTIYDNLDRVEIHNELDGAKIPFVGGDKKLE